jgi:mannose-6-phosphate isomerase-like protein (cupin superfamily)
MYATDGTPTVTGREPDPMAANRPAFPGPSGTYFRIVNIPPRPPEGFKPPPDAFDRFMKEASEKLPGWVEHAHHERDHPGMHTTDSVDYGVVIRGEILLELDDGQSVHLRQGDCVVQNGTRHRWRNPGTEPCLMAFVLIGGRHEG